MNRSYGKIFAIAGFILLLIIIGGIFYYSNWDMYTYWWILGIIGGIGAIIGIILLTKNITKKQEEKVTGLMNEAMFEEKVKMKPFFKNMTLITPFSVKEHILRGENGKNTSIYYSIFENNKGYKFYCAMNRSDETSSAYDYFSTIDKIKEDIENLNNNPEKKIPSTRVTYDPDTGLRTIDSPASELTNPNPKKEGGELE